MDGTQKDEHDDIEIAYAELKKAEEELEIAQSEEQAALRAEGAATEKIEAAEHKIEEALNTKIDFYLDGEKYETRKHHLTPDQIIRDYGKKDPTTNYLVQIEGAHGKSYRDKGEVEIKLHNGARFQIIAMGPTTVSDAVGMAAFMGGLKALDFQPEAVAGAPNLVMFDYVVPIGTFAGQKVRLGFEVPVDFPHTPPSGPHVSPALRPFRTNDGTAHPLGGIHQSAFQEKAVGAWQYWSRPFPDWATSKKSVMTYMGHIFHLWETQ